MVTQNPTITKAEPRDIAGSIPVYCSFDEIVHIESIIPNPKNPNTHPDEQIKLLSQIIKGQGWRMPIVVSTRSGYIVKGHGRLKAAQEARTEYIPVEYQSYATEAEEYADLIADNRIAELSIIDDKLLASLIEEMDEEYQDLTGYSEDELQEILDEMAAETEELTEAEEDEFDSELPDEAVAKRGYIYQLGNHRLMCGDSTDPDDVRALVNGETMSLFITDPPYNVDYHGGTEDKLTIENDSMDDASFRLFLTSAFKNADSVMEQGASFYIWHADSEGYNFRGACRDNDWKVRQCLIWRKNSLVMGRQDYQWQHEPCLYGWKKGSSHFWNSDRKQTTILEFDKPLRNSEHPTMKPIKLFDYLIRNNTKPNDRVIDLFAGSGTTLISSEQNGRISYSMEIDPKYVDVCIRRYINLKGSSKDVYRINSDGTRTNWEEVLAMQ